MTDPLLMLLLGTVLSSVTRLATAAAEVWVLQARARLTAAASRLPAGAELGGWKKDGTNWVIRNRNATKLLPEEVDGDR